MCLNCGHIHTGPQAPQKLPGLPARPGIFHRLDMAPLHPDPISPRKDGERISPFFLSAGKPAPAYPGREGRQEDAVNQSVYDRQK